jgi:1,4-alpha-glucan branching enzyme
MATKKQPATKQVAEKTEKPAKAVKTTAPKAVKSEQKEKAVKVTSPKAAVPAEKPAKTTAKAVKSAKVTFTLPKEAVENAETVAIFGDFNQWQEGIMLTKQKDGSFKAAVELEKGRSYEYRFLINGEKWENDWAAEAYVPTPFGTFNSVVTA